MKSMFQLSGEDPELAKEEVLVLTGVQKSRLIGNLLVIQAGTKGLDKRLAYTHRIYKFLFQTTVDGLEGYMKDFDWQSVYKKNFCLRIYGGDASNEKRFAGYVWEKLKSPEVNLEDPVTAIHLFFEDNIVIAGLLLKEVEKGFEERKAHLRPEFAPVSLHPRLARACVNLTGAGNGDIVMDPFCGTGGLLIEAGLMGLRPAGSDTDERMLRRAAENLDHYNIRDYKLVKKDALLMKKADYVVTDLPYGKNTGRMDLKSLYRDFLGLLKKKLGKRAVVIFPRQMDAEIRKAGLKAEKRFQYYIHRSMTKYIYVISV
ncbi:hypothetical protein GF351_06585 [Candidatus Woesearchaeota archaeon]|nr:hypothetical protein [Candidatus Woesearchaeota archaeon]